MTADFIDRSTSTSPAWNLPLTGFRPGLLAALALLVGGIALVVGLGFRALPVDAPLVESSTPGELAAWMAQQSEEEQPPSLLGSLAKQWAQSLGETQADQAALTGLMQALVLLWCVMTAVGAGTASLGLLRRAPWTRPLLILTLLGMDSLLLVFPNVAGDYTVALVVGGMFLLLAILAFAPGPVTRVIGFFIAISALLGLWTTAKSFAQSVDYALTLPQTSWNYQQYAALEDALAALAAGEVNAVFADRKDLDALLPAYPELRSASLDSAEQVLIFPLIPALPGRLGLAVRAQDAASYESSAQLVGSPVGAVEGSFAADRYLAVPRQLVLLDMKILNDLNLPPLQSIASAFLQPARRNGDFLLLRILAEAGLYTLQEALLGFSVGVVLGLTLGTIFAHSALMERALLPYVVASQTVPILAIAPMVVIWLGASPTSVALIAAYITFFPVTVNTLRGLQSPEPTAVELMHSYAASRWTILWKLRFPAALPYIFTALKVSATASVVGAIIGELPSGIGDGLGRAILNFSSDYSLVSTPKLWAAIISAAGVGILFFLSVSLVERLVLRRYVRSSEG